MTRFQPKNKILNVKFNRSGQNKKLETRKDNKNKKPPFKLRPNLLTRSNWSMSWERSPTTRMSSILLQTTRHLSELTMNTKSYLNNTKKRDKREKRPKIKWQSTRRTCRRNWCNYKTTFVSWPMHTMTWWSFNKDTKWTTSSLKRNWTKKTWS